MKLLPQWVRITIGLLLFLTACSPQTESSNELIQGKDFSLPKGFHASVFAEELGRARHMVIRKNGDVLVRLRKPVNGKCNVVLRGENENGRAELTHYFGTEPCGTGLAIQEPFLYVANRESIVRYKLTQGIEPVEPVVFVSDLGQHPAHSARSLAVSKDFLYVNIGGPSNTCQKYDRTQGSVGQFPCPELDAFGGIYRFPLKGVGYKKAKKYRYASGIRNAMAIDWNPQKNTLYALSHGRDQLNQMSPKKFSVKDNAERPAEEFFEIKQGDDFGWPYCYYDLFEKKKLLNPEYGGDGKKQGLCEGKKNPLIGFPAHYAPNDLLFYRGKQFPESYREGAFIAFHGSWNRYPAPQAGYNVVFVSLKNKSWRIFADGFAGPEPVERHTDAKYRPMALAEAPDGSLFVADSTQGKIWKISYMPDL